MNNPDLPALRRAAEAGFVDQEVLDFIDQEVAEPTRGLKWTKDDDTPWVWVQTRYGNHCVTPQLTVEQCSELAEWWGLEDVADYFTDGASGLARARQQLADFGAEPLSDIATAWADLRLRELLADEARSVMDPWEGRYWVAGDRDIRHRVLDEITERQKERAM